MLFRSDVVEVSEAHEVLPGGVADYVAVLSDIRVYGICELGDGPHVSELRLDERLDASFADLDV